MIGLKQRLTFHGGLKMTDILNRTLENEPENEKQIRGIENESN